MPVPWNRLLPMNAEFFTAETRRRRGILGKSGFVENLVKPPQAVNSLQAIDSVGEINFGNMS